MLQEAVVVEVEGQKIKVKTTSGPKLSLRLRLRDQWLVHRNEDRGGSLTFISRLNGSASVPAPGNKIIVRVQGDRGGNWGLPIPVRTAARPRAFAGAR